MAIPVSNILQPAAISIPAANRQLLVDMQILAPHYYKYWVEKYGNEDYTTFIAAFSGMEEVKGQEFFHFEPRGKNQFAVTNTAQVAAPAAGATVTVTIGAADCFNSGTQSPIRVGETVRIASSGIEGKVLTVNKSTPNAHTMTVRPLKSTSAFVTAGSANLEIGEVIQLIGNTEAGEASSAIDPQMPIDVRITNYVTQIRDDWKATDLEEMEEVFYDFEGDAYVGKQGVSAYSYKGLVKMQTRWNNSCEFKLLKGDIQNNTGLNPGTQGTQGLIPAVRSRGVTATYTVGSLDISKIHEITRLLDVNGGTKQYQWLQDIFQKQEFDDTLFTQYPAGAFVWGTGAASEEASVAYGFQNFMIDGYLFQVKKKKDFNTEVVYGKAPIQDEFRNFGLLVPQGEGRDARTSNKVKNLTMMYQEPVGGGSRGNGIRVWQYGGAAPVPTTGTADHSVSMEAYRGLRTFAANQFLILSGS